MTILKGESVVSSKITDLSILKLPQVWERKIQQIVYDNRMLYELWLESANNYGELRQRLKDRGFTNLPFGSSPLLNMGEQGKPPKAETSSCDVKKTMLRRKKSS